MDIVYRTDRIPKLMELVPCSDMERNVTLLPCRIFYALLSA